MDRKLHNFLILRKKDKEKVFRKWNNESGINYSHSGVKKKFDKSQIDIINKIKKKYNIKKKLYDKKYFFIHNDDKIIDELIDVVIDEIIDVDNNKKNKILVLLLTYNRSNNIESIINMMLKQTYKNYDLLIIDDGSSEKHKLKFNEIKNKTNNKNIIFRENKINLNIPNTINIGIKYFLENEIYDYFTWISDDNIYYNNFLQVLVKSNNYFKYTSFMMTDIIRNKKTVIRNKYTLDSLINNSNGCASFMWTKKAIQEIGFYNPNIHGCEDYEYLLRTLKKNNYKYEDIVLVNYMRHEDSLYLKNNKEIRDIKNNIVKIINYLNNEKKNIIYYSKLLQKEQQIMEIFDKNCNNIFIGLIDNVKYDEKYNLLIVPYKLKDCVFNLINSEDIYLYYTDSELYDEIKDKKYKKICHLKNDKLNSNSENCVKINPEISIVMAYYNRKPQTIETLNGFEKMYAKKYNFEVVIVDDNSNEENRLENIIKNYSFHINLIRINAEEKGDRINPCIAYNKGFSEAIGEIIIIQNPECYHVGDIIKHILDNLSKSDYLSYSCFSANSPEITREMIESDNIYDLIKNKDFLVKNKPSKEMVLWYNHPTILPKCYHFCSAIYKNNLNIIGGFNKKFKDGFCYDDDEFIHKIKHNLKLNVKILDPNICLVIHQYHQRNYVDFKYKNLLQTKWIYNQNLLSIYVNSIKFNFPKLFHTYWDGSQMSYLTYLTYVSFLKYHSDWTVILHIPKYKYDKITWITPEQKQIYKGTNYFNKLLNNPNININYVNFEEIGFYNNVSEVIKSDYLRYYMLYKYGGVWSDNDIIYINNIEKKINFSVDNIMFKCSYNNITYYPIGFFCCKRGSLIFKKLLGFCKSYYDKNYYQCIGATMIQDLLKKNKLNIESTIFLDNSYYLPFHFNQLDCIFKKLNNNLKNNTFGIHWFNGSKDAKIYQNRLSDRICKFTETCLIDNLIKLYVKSKKYYENFYVTPEKTYDKINAKKWLLNKIPKRLFVYWGGEKLPYLRYLTVDSFIKFNPEWEIIFIIPKILSNVLTWGGKQFERNDLKYIDYMSEIYKLEKQKKIKIEIFDFETIGINNDLNEVHKSDYLRYYLLYSRGGVWSDVDILFYESINLLSINKQENINKDVFVKYKDINDKEIGIDGHAIGFLLGSKGNLFFKEVFNLAKLKYKVNVYQGIGPDLLNDYYPIDNKIKKQYNLECITKSDIYCLDHNTYSLFKWYEDNEFDKYYINKSIGIHWYGGHLDFKDVLMTLNSNNLKNHPNNGFVVNKIRNIYIKKNKIDFNNIMKKKFSIVMAYYNRKKQLKLTLRSIKQSKIIPYEIIICDDGSDKDQILKYDDINSYNLNIKIITINKKDKTWLNPCIAYNKAIKETTGDIIVIQNPEVYHLYDCLNYIKLNLKFNDWISFNIYGLPNFKSNDLIDKNEDPDHIFNLISNFGDKIGGTELLKGGGGGWLNNKNHFVAYHYLAAIHRVDLFEKFGGGFCELYKNGPCYDDDDLIKHLVYKKFNFKIAPFRIGEPMGIHLYHKKSHEIKNFDILHKKNGVIFNQRMKNINFKPIVSIYSSPINEKPKPNITEYKQIYLKENNFISLIIISTNLKRRFYTLVKTINSFKKINKNNFDEIILSIDILENYGETMTKKEIIKFMSQNKLLKGDQIFFKKGEGMVSNQCNVVGLAKGNIIIYSEDDIIMKRLPSRKNILELTKNGVINYNKDLSYSGKNKEEDMELYKIGNQYNKKNFIQINKEYFYKKDKNRYGCEFNRYKSGRNLSVLFPCAIMQKKVFTKVYNEIIKLDYSFHIEASFSHVINSSSMESYIFCSNKNIPLEVPWLYRDNSTEIAVAGETIDRNMSKLSLLTIENIENYNKNNKFILIKDVNTLTEEKMINVQNTFNNLFLNYKNTYLISNLKKKINNILLSNKPIFISRIGGSDMNFVFRYLMNINYDIEFKILKEFNGYFDNSDNKKIIDLNVKKFIKFYIESLRNNEFTSFVEFLGMFINKSLYNTLTIHRDNLLNKLFINKSIIFDYNSTFCNPEFIINGMDIWAKGKKILFVSPFSESIKYQYNRKEYIHNNLEMPYFDLLTYKTPITYNDGNKINFKNANNWFEACDIIFNDIKNIDFDIAFLSCGCYANELGYRIKNILKKKAIYLGGGLNLLFNIYGKRYENKIWKPIADKYLNYNYQIKAFETKDIENIKCSRRFKSEGLNAYF